MNILISSNIFNSNVAFTEGGAVKWNDENPTFIDNTFLNNSALYGADIASFPIRIILKCWPSDDNESISLPSIDDILWNKFFVS